MITVQTQETSSPLSLTPSTKQSSSLGGSFSELLHSLSLQNKTLKEGSLVLNLNKKDSTPSGNTTATSKNLKDAKSSMSTTSNTTQSKQTELLSLLTGEIKPSSTFINPSLNTAMDAKQLKSLMKDAKNYLSDQIKNTDTYKRGEIKELPKTVQGLVTLAKKIGIDVSKITVETVQSKGKQTSTTNSAKVSLKTSETTKSDSSSSNLNQVLAAKKESVSNSNQQTNDKNDKAVSVKELKSNDIADKQKSDQNTNTVLEENKAQSKPSVAIKDTPSQSNVAQQNQKTVITTQSSVKENTSVPSLKENTTAPSVKESATAAQDKNDQKTDIMQPQNTNIEQSKNELSSNMKRESPNVAATSTPLTEQTATQSEQNSIQQMPIFVTQTQQTTHSTAEIVNKNQLKTPQEQIAAVTTSPLSTLLNASRATNLQNTAQESKSEVKTDSSMKANSSVLTQLLHGENTSASQTTQTSNSQDNSNLFNSNQGTDLHVKQTESDLGVKMNEAKQMVKYLAQDIKQAIDNYKPPFTRIKLKLNPEKLGEVDLTVVQRGKNVHVNISSNNAAITALAQNANDLKSQLTQNGMNNASLNFNSSADTQTQQQQQQSQQQSGQQRENAKKAYEAFNQDDTNEEILNSLEIVIPRYA